ncbi:hypothetical protein KKG29_00845 [Patescibacteria group bacterium]|nr:hypothetical protein [Patescibacteria group bacterium]MBU3999712.1 hypothetical protein [Patescibacteria group bacterium]MBU4056629.1 hypothetical protein [Patescibacteria group bacterium]MBU4368358.1 hypothetical protein [Patescibacteria group bacterium]
MESRENKDISKELNIEKYKEDAILLEKAKEKMLEMGLFDKDFINSLNFVFIDAFEKDGEYQEVGYHLTEDGSIVSYNNEDSDRTKEVGVVTLSLLGKIDQFFDIHNDKNKSQHIWLGNLDKSVFLSFDAAGAHEIAHTKSYGAITREKESLFDEEKFKELVIKLIENDPVLSKDESVDFLKFNYSDENWSELYALLYHREFLRRENSDNDKMIKEWDNHIIEVANDLQGAMKKFNQEKNTNIDPEVIYKDGHAFSFLLARVFEEKYKDFNERIKVLESCKKE